MRNTPWDNGLHEDFQSRTQHLNISSSSESLERFRNAAHILQSGAIQWQINLNDSFFEVLDKFPSQVAVVSGFDTAGILHIGHGVALKTLQYFSELGCEVRVPLSDLEAISVRDTSADESLQSEVRIRQITANLGLEKSATYRRSEVPGILTRMAELSGKWDENREKLHEIYGFELSQSEAFSVIFMAADLLRPYYEGAIKVLAIYGIDESPHIIAINSLAESLGLPPIAAVFNKLIPSINRHDRKMSKSLEGQGANLLLDSSASEIENTLLNYEVGDPCMVEALRRYFLTEVKDISEEEICTLSCSECKFESAGAMIDWFEKERLL